MKKIFALALALMLVLTSGAWAVSISTVNVRDCYVGRTYEPGVPTPVFIEASNIHYSSYVVWSVFDTYTYGMPPGLYKSPSISSCLLYGTPTQAGVYHMEVIIEVSDYYYEEEYYDSSYFDLTIYPAIPQITTTSPDEGVKGGNYSYELHADVYSNDISGLTWEKVSGDLPGGLSLDKNTGIISGIPEEAGDFKFTVKAVNTFTADAVDLKTDSDTQELMITITASSKTGEDPEDPEGQDDPADDTKDPDKTDDTTNPNEQEQTDNTSSGSSGSSGGGGGCNSFGILGVMLIALIAFRKR